MGRTIKFYTDENAAGAVITQLRQRGIDVLSTPEAGMMGAADVDHLRLAGSLGRVLYTQDRDYLVLHAQGMAHAGIVYALPFRSVRQIINGLVLVYELLDPADLINRVEYL